MVKCCIHLDSAVNTLLGIVACECEPVHVPVLFPVTAPQLGILCAYGVRVRLSDEACRW